MENSLVINGFSGSVEIDTTGRDFVFVNGCRFPFGCIISKTCDCETGDHIGWSLIAPDLDNWGFAQEIDFKKAIVILATPWN